VDRVNVLEFHAAVCREPVFHPPFLLEDDQIDTPDAARPVTCVC